LATHHPRSEPSQPRPRRRRRTSASPTAAASRCKSRSVTHVTRAAATLPRLKIQGDHVRVGDSARVVARCRVRYALPARLRHSPPEPYNGSSDRASVVPPLMRSDSLRVRNLFNFGRHDGARNQQANEPNVSTARVRVRPATSSCDCTCVCCSHCAMARDHWMTAVRKLTEIPSTAPLCGARIHPNLSFSKVIRTKKGSCCARNRSRLRISVDSRAHTLGSEKRGASYGCHCTTISAAFPVARTTRSMHRSNESLVQEKRTRNNAKRA